MDPDPKHQEPVLPKVYHSPMMIIGYCQEKFLKLKKKLHLILMLIPLRVNIEKYNVRMENSKETPWFVCGFAELMMKVPSMWCPAVDYKWCASPPCFGGNASPLCVFHFMTSSSSFPCWFTDRPNKSQSVRQTFQLDVHEVEETKFLRLTIQ